MQLSSRELEIIQDWLAEFLRPEVELSFLSEEELALLAKLNIDTSTMEA